MNERPSFLSTLTGRITAFATFITAVTTLILAVKGCDKSITNEVVPTPAPTVIIVPSSTPPLPQPQPLPEPVPIPAPVNPEALVINVSGKWQNSGGTFTVFEQDHDDLTILENNAFNIQVGNANGTIKNRDISYSGFDSSLGYPVNYSCKMKLARDGSRMTGTLTIPLMGVQMPYTLTRE